MIVSQGDAGQDGAGAILDRLERDLAEASIGYK
jgi:hypothetical protein